MWHDKDMKYNLAPRWDRFKPTKWALYHWTNSPLNSSIEDSGDLMKVELPFTRSLHKRKLISVICYMRHSFELSRSIIQFRGTNVLVMLWFFSLIFYYELTKQLWVLMIPSYLLITVLTTIYISIIL